MKQMHKQFSNGDHRFVKINLSLIMKKRSKLRFESKLLIRQNQVLHKNKGLNYFLNEKLNPPAMLGRIE